MTQPLLKVNQQYIKEQERFEDAARESYNPENVKTKKGSLTLKELMPVVRLYCV